MSFEIELDQWIFVNVLKLEKEKNDKQSDWFDFAIEFIHWIAFGPLLFWWCDSNNEKFNGSHF